MWCLLAVQASIKVTSHPLVPIVPLLSEEKENKKQRAPCPLRDNLTNVQ
jgi:hypothetical protein